VIRVEVGDDLEVSKSNVGHRVQEGGAGDSAVPPLILVLEECGRGPLFHRELNLVASGTQGLGDVELGRQMGVTARPDWHAVDGHQQHPLRRADVEDHPPLLATWVVECSSVDAHRVAIRDLRVRLVERHEYIRIMWSVSVRAHRPQIRNGDDVPTLVHGP
jgi:hypothetical protein